MEVVDSYESEQLARQRRAAAVQLYTQQLGVAHLRSKAAAAAAPSRRRSGGRGSRKLDLGAHKATDPQRRRQRLQQPGVGSNAAAVASAADTVRIVCGAAGVDQQQQHLQQHELGRPRPRRTRRPVALELAGFSPLRTGDGNGVTQPRAVPARTAADDGTQTADRGPPPGWVRVNADGEELEAAPVDGEDYVMEAADDATFDEEEWV